MIICREFIDINKQQKNTNIYTYIRELMVAIVIVGNRYREME